MTENLEFRRRVLKSVRAGEADARHLVMMCTKDVLFYVNTFCWIYEPRPGGQSGRILPFVTFPVQNDVLVELDAAIGVEDICLDKSRDGGATWLMLSAFLRQWQFFDRVSFMLVSRNEDLVDSANDPSSLFGKLDFILEIQPTWLLPDRTRTFCRLYNKGNKSVIVGESTTGNMGAGSRHTAIGMDEFARVMPVSLGFAALAATQSVSNCRIINSTHQGVMVAYYAVFQNPNVKKLVLDWKDDPRKNPGLYTSKNGRVVFLDETYWLDGRHAGYLFRLDGKVRSPWYDAEEDKDPTPGKRIIAQEVDRNPIAETGQFFDAGMIDEHSVTYAMAPFASGELDYNDDLGEPHGFIEGDGQKRLSLWLTLIGGKPPPGGKYAIGVDVSSGMGSSNSVLSVANIRTGEKVAEFTSPHIETHVLALYCASLGRFFADDREFPAFVVCEGNGPMNRLFLRHMIELGYGNLYYRKKSVGGLSEKVSNMPGWGSGRNTKQELLGEYARALLMADFINRSKIALDECKQYVFTVGGGVDHIAAVNAVDPSGARDNHGDRVIADALCWLGMRERKPLRLEVAPTLPVGSVGWRMKQRERQLQEARYW